MRRRCDAEYYCKLEKILHARYCIGVCHIFLQLCAHNLIQWQEVDCYIRILSFSTQVRTQLFVFEFFFTCHILSMCEGQKRLVILRTYIVPETKRTDGLGGYCWHVRDLRVVLIYFFVILIVKAQRYPDLLDSAKYGWQRLTNATRGVTRRAQLRQTRFRSLFCVFDAVIIGCDNQTHCSASDHYSIPGKDYVEAVDVFGFVDGNYGNQSWFPLASAGASSLKRHRTDFISWRNILQWPCCKLVDGFSIKNLKYCIVAIASHNLSAGYTSSCDIPVESW